MAHAPEGDTRSISRSPGFVTSHWSVLIGIICLSKEPGRVVPYSLRFRGCLRGRRRRSSWRGLMASRWRSWAGGSQTRRRSQGRLQPHRTPIARRLPELGQPIKDRVRIPRRPAGSSPGLRLHQRSIEQPNGLLAVIPTDPHELIQAPLLLHSATLPVALIDGLQVRSPRLLRHPSLLHATLRDPQNAGRRVRKPEVATKACWVRLYAAQFVMLYYLTTSDILILSIL